MEQTNGRKHRDIASEQRWPPNAIRLFRIALIAIAATVPFAIPQLFGLKPIFQRFSVSQAYYLKLAGLSVGMLGLIAIVILRLPLRRPSALFNCYLVYLVCILISILRNPVPGYGLAEAILPLTGACFLFVLEITPTSRRAQESLFLLLVAVGLIAALYGILQNFGFELIQTVDPATQRQVLVSFFGHSNFMASFLAPILFLAVYFVAPRHNARLRLFAAAAIAATVLCLYWAGTRAASVAVIAGALTLVRFQWPHIKIGRQRLGAVAGIALLIVVAATLWGQYGGRHSDTLLRRFSSHREIRNRVFLWLVGMEMIGDKPLFGIGYGRYNAEFWPYCEEYVQQPGHEIYVYVLREMRGLNPGQMHNDLLETACETGVLGVAAFIGIWLLALLYCCNCIRSGDPTADRNLARCLRAALVCIFVDSLFGFPLQLPASAMLFWIVLGSIVQTHRRIARRRAAAAADTPAADLATAGSTG